MTERPKNILQNLLNALKAEKEKERLYYEDIIRKMELSERREKGLTWYPLKLVESGYALGDYPYVVLEKPEQINERHKFQSGQVVNLFSEHGDTEGNHRKGVIHYIKKQQVKIILYSLPMPYWIYDGKLGIDQLYDERSYQEMEKALKRVIRAKQDRLAELRDIVYGVKDPADNELIPQFEHPDLNPSQISAVRDVISSKDVSVIHGPPGTGKTTTIVAAAKVLATRERQILVCASSNAATDLLTERLSNAGLQVVRLGNISRVNEDLVELTLDGQVSKHPDNKELKKLKKKAAEMRRQAEKYKRNFGAKERHQRRSKKQEAREMESWVRAMEDRLVDHVLHSAQVICCTLVGAGMHYLDRLKFRTLIIDEAAQALEPACWIAIARASKIVLAGDPFQLPPTIKSEEAKQLGLNHTLVEKAIQNLPEVFLLDTQYRMNQLIMNFSNQCFYEGKLQAHKSVKDHTLNLINQRNIALEFIDTAGCGFAEKQNPETLSYRNPDEYTLLREHLDMLIENCPEGEIPQIGIISPYKEQVIHMKTQIRQDEEFLHQYALTINTIDSFQGQERDVIYISLVRSNQGSEIGFLKDTRRMNVAMTRARKKLIVIGDSATIGTHPFYEKLLEYCEENQAYFSAWEFMAS